MRRAPPPPSRAAAALGPAALLCALGCSLQHPAGAGAGAAPDAAVDAPAAELTDATPSVDARDASAEAGPLDASDVGADAPPTRDADVPEATDVSAADAVDAADAADAADATDATDATDAADGDGRDDAAAVDAPCAAPLVRCGGACVDTSASRAHCGGCDRPCGSRCAMGVCQDVSFVGAGAAHTCAVLRGGALRCWGSNGESQLGDGSTTRRTRPAPVVGILAADVAPGVDHTCATLTDGRVACWGDNFHGELGDSTMENTRATPVVVVGLAGVVQTVAGENFTCARLADGTARCWGDGEHGRLGNGAMGDRATPVAVTGLSEVVDIAVGGDHACAALRDGSARCWGRNERRQLGLGAGTSGMGDRNLPTMVNGLSNVVQVEAGDKHTCALLSTGAVLCWGDNREGQLGNGTTTDQPLPTLVGGLATTTVVELACGGDQCCAVVADASLRCWGANASGQLGNGTTARQLLPSPVPGLTDAVQVATRGDGHTCVRFRDGATACWGLNDDGQVGDGSMTWRPTPTVVTF